MNARNPKQNGFNTIDVEIEHPTHGWIPFTADPNDPAGAEIYAAAIAGEYGQIAEYISPPPPPPPTKAQISALRQAACQLESDPLFFKWQRGEATQQQWLDKIAEIRARYPNPTDEVPINE